MRCDYLLHALHPFMRQVNVIASQTQVEVVIA